MTRPVFILATDLQPRDAGWPGVEAQAAALESFAGQTLGVAPRVDLACLPSRSTDEPGEYDLVGGHFSPALLDGVVARGDLVVGLLREPTARFLSGVTHCRRLGEDPETFSPSQQAMREMRLIDFVNTEHGRYEACAQLI